MSTPTQMLEAVKVEMQTTVDRAKAAGRDLNADEITFIEAKADEARDLKATIDRQEKGAALRKSISDLGRTIEEPSQFGSGRLSTARKGHIALTGSRGKATSDRIVNTTLMPGVKSLAAVGAVTTAIPINADPATIGIVPTSVLEALPTTVRDTPVYRYLRQTVRTNNAAIVKPGDTKPTSIVTVEPVDGQLQVFAHISEFVDEYLLKDTDTLQSFVSTQLLLMLQEAVEGEIIAGPGTAGHLRGVLNTSGIQTQAYATDKVTTLRLASLALETAGHAAELFIVNAGDWASIETQRVTSGSFDLGGPVDRAAQKLWGVQVVTSTRIPAGTALALDRAALGIDTDGSIETKWDQSTGFDKNQVRARVEGRFGLSVFQPTGIVKVALASA